MNEKLPQIVRRTRFLLQDMKQSGVTAVPKAHPAGSNRERPLASKEQRLSPVQKEALGCTRCRLCQGRTQVVFGEGSLDAKVVFVGEGPGREEDLQGLPFVGAAGKLLTQILGEMGLKREAVYIANVVKCRPPNNRPPQPDEVASCFPYLKAQLNILRPQVICALGRTAANALLGIQASLGDLRGKRCEWEGTPLVVTFHPAYLLRNPSGMALVRQDMKQVLELLKVQ